MPLVTADTAEFGSDVGVGDMLLELRGKLRLGERWSLIEAELGKVPRRQLEVRVRGGENVAGEGRAEREGWVAEAGVRYLFD